MLAELLGGLARQRFVKTTPSVSVVIVDNDPSASASEMVAAATAAFPYPVVYCIEPARGFSQVRNRALREAGADVDFVAFIDDDEMPAQTWLDDLLATQVEYSAGLVAGPVIPVLRPDAPAWVARGKFFDRPHRPTGSLLDFAGSGNLLISQAVIARVGLFDERFGATGGEDTDFTMRARRAGFGIVWCDEAVVSETVEAKRLNVRWLCDRSFSAGKNFYRLELSQSSTLRTRSGIFAKAVGRGLEGVMWIVISPFTGFHRTVRGLRSITRAAGIVSALTQAKSAR